MSTPATNQTDPKFSRKATRLGIPPLGPYISEALRYRTFAVYWSKADIKARNFETLLGRAWHILNPFLFGLIYFIFVGIIGGGGLGSTERLAFIVGNLYIWGFMSGTISTGSGSIQGGAGGVMAQSAIPRVILPFASTLTSTELFLRSLLAYVPLHIISGRGLHIEMLWLPYLLLITGLFGFGFAMIFAVLNVYIRDISRLLPHMLRLWLYLSPAIWAYTRVLGDTTFHNLARLNPMFSGMAAWTIAFGGTLAPEGPGMLSLVTTFTIWAVVIGVAGFLIFVSREDDFAIRN